MKKKKKFLLKKKKPVKSLPDVDLVMQITDYPHAYHEWRLIGRGKASVIAYSGRSDKSIEEVKQDARDFIEKYLRKDLVIDTDTYHVYE